MSNMEELKYKLQRLKDDRPHQGWRTVQEVASWMLETGDVMIAISEEVMKERQA